MNTSSTRSKGIFTVQFFDNFTNTVLEEWNTTVANYPSEGVITDSLMEVVVPSPCQYALHRAANFKFSFTLVNALPINSSIWLETGADKWQFDALSVTSLGCDITGLPNLNSEVYPKCSIYTIDNPTRQTLRIDDFGAIGPGTRVSVTVRMFNAALPSDDRNTLKVQTCADSKSSNNGSKVECTYRVDALSDADSFVITNTPCMATTPGATAGYPGVTLTPNQAGLSTNVSFQFTPWTNINASSGIVVCCEFPHC